MSGSGAAPWLWPGRQCGAMSLQDMLRRPEMSRPGQCRTAKIVSYRTICSTLSCAPALHLQPGNTANERAIVAATDLRELPLLGQAGRWLDAASLPGAGQSA